MILSTEECKINTLSEKLCSFTKCQQGHLSTEDGAVEKESWETWTVCGKHCKNLVRKWLAGFETVGDVVELLTMDGVTR